MGRLGVCLVALGLGVFVLLEIHPFLMARGSVPSDLLVVEGWCPPNTMPQAAAFFSANSCQRMLLVRESDEFPDAESRDAATDYMARILLKAGIPKNKISVLYVNGVKKDRTYHGAEVAKEWLSKQGWNGAMLNIATMSCHCRRSRLLYEKAFGYDIKIGTVPLQSLEYEPSHWWRYSEGVREVVGESIAYLYVRLFFWPKH
jgi:hypothetical protein